MSSARDKLLKANKENKAARGNTSTDNTIYTDYTNREIDTEKNKLITEQKEVEEIKENKEVEYNKENNEPKTFDFVISPSEKNSVAYKAARIPVNYNITQLASNVVFVKSKQDGITLSEEMDKIFRELMEKEQKNPSKVEISFENVKRTKRKGDRVKASFVLHKDIIDFINNESRRRLMNMSEFVESILESFAK